MSSQCILDAIKKVAENEGTENPEISNVNMDEHGYVAAVNVVKVIGTSGKKLSLFLKTKEYRENPQFNANLNNLFLLESNFYTNVFEAFVILDNEKGNPQKFDSIPKCYYGSDEVIILRDLHADGFKLWHNIKEPVDQTHVSKVFEEYGKFHGRSLALKYHKPEVFYKLAPKKCFMEEVLLYYDNDFIESVAMKACASFGDNEIEKKAAFLKFVHQDMRPFLKKMFREENNWEVILHGDCWTNNYMFKYKGDKIEKMHFVDFQLSTIGHPVADLSYFVCTSGSSQTTFDRIEEHLKTYWEHLKTTMNALKCPDKQIPTFDDVKNNWTDYGKYGILWAMIINKMLVADADELKAHKGAGVLDGFNFISRHEEMYRERMRSSMNYFWNKNAL